MYLYFESLGKNLTAVIFGLFFMFEELPKTTRDENSTLFLILTIIVPSIISGIVTVLIEYFKSRGVRGKGE